VDSAATPPLTESSLVSDLLQPLRPKSDSLKLAFKFHLIRDFLNIQTFLPQSWFGNSTADCRSPSNLIKICYRVFQFSYKYRPPAITTWPTSYTHLAAGGPQPWPNRLRSDAPLTPPFAGLQCCLAVRLLVWVSDPPPFSAHMLAIHFTVCRQWRLIFNNFTGSLSVLPVGPPGVSGNPKKLQEGGGTPDHPPSLGGGVRTPSPPCVPVKSWPPPLGGGAVCSDPRTSPKSLAADRRSPHRSLPLCRRNQRVPQSPPRGPSNPLSPSNTPTPVAGCRQPSHAAPNLCCGRGRKSICRLWVCKFVSRTRRRISSAEKLCFPCHPTPFFV